MNLTSLERVTKRYAEKQPLDEVSFGIDDGDRVGVIGPNGSGKSTLLRIVAGAEQPDSGRVVHASHLRIAYLAQEPMLNPDQTVGEAGGGADRGVGTVGGRGSVRHVEAMLDRLGLRDLDRRVGELSTGQRKRVALARVLATDVGLSSVGGETGLLVLDEPTNHLDVHVVQWLEDLLRARRGALLLVTHDRYLLDRLATRIVEVRRGSLYAHHGSYEAYLEARAARAEQAETAERRRRNRLRTELEWLRRTPNARTSKSRHRTEQALALLDRPTDMPTGDVELDLPSRRLGNLVVDLHNAGKRYGDRWVLRGIDHRLAPRSRIGLVGPNGAGKTTLLRLIAGRIEPDAGSVRIGETVAIGWYGQDPEPLPPQARVLGVVDDEARSTRLTSGLGVSAGQLLERFGFEPEAQRAYVSELSGGERRRLELLRVLAGAPNLLLLDEPTNDLDLDTLGALEEYLDAWPGAFVVATHDRYFLDRVCDDVYSIEPDGGLRHHPGGWPAYAATLVSERVRPARSVARARTPQARPRMLSYRERRERDQLDARLPALEARKVELTEELARAGGDYEAAQRIGDEFARLLDEIDQAETRWLELAEIEEGV